MKRIFVVFSVGLICTALTFGGSCSCSNQLDISDSQTIGQTDGGEKNDNPSVHKHVWGDPTYTWASDYSSCTAERVCVDDALHKETETKESNYTISTLAGCETKGQGLYTVVFDNGAFSNQTHIVALDPINHNWEEPTYEWNVDYSQCTAARVCSNDSTHIETETVNSTYQEITPATEETEGVGRYTAVFTNTAFKVQTYNITLTPTRYHGEYPVVSEDEKTVIYGLYPQTNIDDSSLVSALDALTAPESNGWFLYGGDYYAKVSATPHDTRYKFDNGTTILSGTTYWFKCEPIVWNVLNNNSSEYHIVSSVLLDAHCYYNSTSSRTIDDETIYPNNYRHSEIRAWLNADFYNSAFVLGNKHIQITNVDNSAATTESNSNAYACANTRDKVFLLSYKDYINSSYGFSTSISKTKTRYCRTTDWARARGAYQSLKYGTYAYNGSYWTRSPFDIRSEYVENVGVDGAMDILRQVDIATMCVRPGLSITIA